MFLVPNPRFRDCNVSLSGRADGIVLPGKEKVGPYTGYRVFNDRGSVSDFCCGLQSAASAWTFEQHPDLRGDLL